VSNLRGLKILVLIEIKSSLASVKFEEVTGSFVGSAESKGVRTAKVVEAAGAFTGMRSGVP